jgi:hypothetical protein
MAMKKFFRFLGSEVLKLKAKRAAKRRRRASNFSEIKSIGIIYDATDRNAYQSVVQYIRLLKEERKHVATFGFINSKDKSQFLTPKLSDNYFSRFDINLLQLPKKEEIKSFIDEEFDLLIDLSTTTHLPLHYIFALSCARFKVSGNLAYQQEHGDLTIDISKQNTVEYLIIQLKHYLNLVNKKAHAV